MREDSVSCLEDRGQTRSVGCHCGERTRLHELVDDEEIVKADETGRIEVLYVRSHQKALLVWSLLVDGCASEIESQERRIVSFLTQRGVDSGAFINAFLLPHEAMLGQFIDPQIIIKYSGAKSGLFDMLDVLAEEKPGHLLVTALQGPPALDQHIALRKGTA